MNAKTRIFGPLQDLSLLESRRRTRLIKRLSVGGLGAARDSSHT